MRIRTRISIAAGACALALGAIAPVALANTHYWSGYFYGVGHGKSKHNTAGYAGRTFNNIYGNGSVNQCWFVSMVKSGPDPVAENVGCGALPVTVNYSGPYLVQAHCGRFDANAVSTLNNCWTNP